VADTSARLSNEEIVIQAVLSSGNITCHVLKDFDPDFVSFWGSYFHIFDSERLAYESEVDF
jgi:hypothetical protein